MFVTVTCSKQGMEREARCRVARALLEYGFAVTVQNPNVKPIDKCRDMRGVEVKIQ